MLLEKMARNTKKKLAIFAGTSKCLIYAEAKYCASEMPGEIKYYECSRTEYCCGIGCCVSPGLPFHHLWYYWILVIIMFLVCSGGGWWYRYWLQGRYRAAASAIPPRAGNSRGQSSVRGGTCQGQRARISYNSARNTVLLHRMWKGPQRNGAVPAYNANATTSAHYQNMSVVLNDANCPYYQLYGPPPSYETVIAQTRGKISNPVSPEPISASARTAAQSPNIPPANSNLPHCFSYTCNFSPRLNNGFEQNAQPTPTAQPVLQTAQAAQTGSRQVDETAREPMPFAHFSHGQYCTVADATIPRNVCVPFPYEEQPFLPRDTFDRMYQASCASYAPYPMDKSSDTSDADNQAYQASSLAEKYAMVKVDCTPGSSREDGAWKLGDRCITKMHGRQVAGGSSNANAIEIEIERAEKSRGEEGQGRSGAARACLLKMEEGGGGGGGDNGGSERDSKSAVSSLEDFFSEVRRSRRACGGSLRATGRYAGNDSDRCEEYSVEKGFSKILPHSCDGLIDAEPAAAASVDATCRVETFLEDRANANANSFQSNPSNNVILERLVSEHIGASCSTGNVGKLEQSRSRLANVSTNSDLESKHRLDRSKSLD